MSKKRFIEIDIIKALGIICVVLGHASSPFHDFIYLFHMAVFFMASGFFFKDSSTDNLSGLGRSIISKIKGLWLPYFIWNSIFVLLHNQFIMLNIYTENLAIKDYVSGAFIHTMPGYSKGTMLKMIIKSIWFGSGEELLGAGWFLQILFLISVGYLIINFIGKKFFKENVLLFQFIVSIVLLGIGFYCSKIGWSRFGLERAASFYCLYFIGVVFGKSNDKISTWNYKVFLPALIISFGLLKFLETIGTMELASNSYINPLFLILASFLGWIFLYSLAYFIKKISLFRTIFATIGQHTLAVLILHFLAMKIVNAIAVAIDGVPAFCIAAFPNYNGEVGLWWIIYTVVGVVIPVVLSITYHIAFNKVLHCKVC